MKEHPLNSEPKLDENGLLNDPAQLREVVKKLAEQLGNILENPKILLEPYAVQALITEESILHQVTCSGCAEKRSERGEHLHESVVLGLHTTFTAFVKADERIKEQQDVEKLYSALAGTSFPGMN